MQRGFGWFISGIVIGAILVSLVFFGMYLERNGSVRNLTIAQSVLFPEKEMDSDKRAEDPEIAEIRESIAALAERTRVSGTLTQGRQNALTQVVSSSSSAVVGITVTQIQRVRQQEYVDPFWSWFFKAPGSRVIEEPVENLGSGFVLSPDGYVVTNEHVVHDADEILVTMSDGRSFPAKFVGADYDFDLALVKIEGDNLPFLQICPTDEVIVGEWAIAIGNPFGLFKINDQPSVSVGVISALDRDWQRQRDGRFYRNMIQTDAAINPGNSGGPLLNVMGHVIGVNTFIFAPGEQGGSVGVGFAIPAKQLRDTIDELRAREGFSQDIWTGVAVQAVDQWIANSLSYPHDHGVIITEVDVDSPGDRSGLRPRDILFEVGGTKILGTRSILDYFKNHDLRVGDQLEFKMFRDGKDMIVTLKLEALPK